jgi:hypothetical protein
MFTHRSISQNRSRQRLAVLAVLTLLVTTLLLVRAMSALPGGSLFAGHAGQAESAASHPGWQAESERLAGLARWYAAKQAHAAEAARWSGLAALYPRTITGDDSQRVVDAWAARWTGLAATFARP